MSKSLFVYGNWSAYDELSDGVLLTEELAMRQMDHLVRLKSHGVRFDSYLMDAFWYDPDGAYRTWRKSTWPDGPDRWFDACAENKLLPGLWFTANTLFHMTLPPRWRDSIDAKSWGLCCFEGGFLADFLEVLDDWYERGVRIFKLDFAEFGAVPVGQEDRFSAVGARTLNVEAFQAGLKGFRASHPEAIFMGFNGFDHRECMDRSDHEPGEYISPSWLDVFDSLYAGDPRPADLPGGFWSSVDFYADCMTRLFESSGIPLDRIDNCGFMAGPTGTCYWRGTAEWKRSLLLSLARGGRIHVAYGDLGAFTDEDAVWWSEVQSLYAPFLASGTTRSIGGWPGSGNWFGWESALGERRLATIVNPGLSRVNAPFDSRDLKIVAANRAHENLEDSTLEIEPGEVLVLGSKDLDSVDLPDEELGEWHEFDSASAEGREVKLSVSYQPGRIRVVVVQSAPDGTALRTFPTDSTEFPISVEVADRRGSYRLAPMFDKKIWSGISWGSFQFELNGDSEIRVSNHEDRNCSLSVKLYSFTRR